MDAVAKEDVAVLQGYPRRLSPGIVYSAVVDTPHDMIPRDGPPAAPIADFLKRLP
jgi:hypothetical protein